MVTLITGSVLPDFGFFFVGDIIFRQVVFYCEHNLILTSWYRTVVGI